MSRKSSFWAPGTVITLHVAPPSVVRTTAPPVPLAQTTFSLTTERPRNEAVVSTFCLTHWAEAVIDNKRNVRTIANRMCGYELLVLKIGGAERQGDELRPRIDLLCSGIGRSPGCRADRHCRPLWNLVRCH